MRNYNTVSSRETSKLLKATAGLLAIAALSACGPDKAGAPESPRSAEATTTITVDQAENLIEHGDVININTENASEREVSKVATGETLRLLETHSANFDDWRGLELDILKRNNLLSAEEASFLDEQYASLSQKSDKSTYTDNEVLAAVALDIADAGGQEAPDFELGTAMLPLVMNENQANYYKVYAVVADPHAGTAINVYRQGSADLKHPTGVFMDEKIENAKDTRAIVQTMIAGANGRNTEVFTEVGLYVLNSDNQGNEQWQTVERYGLDDPEAQAAVEALRN